MLDYIQVGKLWLLRLWLLFIMITNSILWLQSVMKDRPTITEQFLAMTLKEGTSLPGLRIRLFFCKFKDHKPNGQ